MTPKKGQIRHEYVVIYRSPEFADRVEIGQFLYVPKYMGKEYTWQYMNTKTMEETGFITGLHRRKTSVDEIKAEAEADKKHREQRVREIEEKKEGRKILSKYYSPLSGRYGSEVTTSGHRKKE
jgi:hypothetical protein